jgi:HlyD family secretion protein
VVRAHIDQEQAAPLNVGDAARISVPEISGTIPGKVTMVSPALDPGSTTVEVWVQAANPQERLRPGGSAKLTIVAQAVPGAVVIPAVALLTAPDGSASVIVVDAQNKPLQKSVKIGIRNADEAQITEGLQAGERVVTVGAYDLSKEDPDVLAKTKVQVQEPSSPASGGSDEESAKSKPEAAGGNRE